MEKILVKDFLLSKNPNHPKKGDRIKVEPIRNLYDIKYIKKKLSNRPRDYNVNGAKFRIVFSFVPM